MAIRLLLAVLVVAVLASTARAEDDRVRAALDSQSLTYEVTEQGNYRLTLPATEGRTQIVIIQAATKNSRGIEIREVWSPIVKNPGPLSQDLVNKLLKDNNLCKLGAWQVYESEGTHMVTFCSKVPADLDGLRLHDFILSAIEIADDMEKQVTGTDEF
jgi:hypothetical protein